jgi:hypothetical protein
MKAFWTLLLLIAPACQTGAVPEEGAPPPQLPAQPSPAAPVPGADRVGSLEAEARALARTDGCSGGAACRVAPVGWRACGGPRDYVAYCATSTDTVALFTKLDELRRAEEAMNQESGAISTCEFRMPPDTELRAGSCRATLAPGVESVPR